MPCFVGSHGSLVFRCIIALSVAAAWLRQGVFTAQLGVDDSSLPGLWRLGFGAARTDSVIYLKGVGLIGCVLLANLPQAIISFIYLFYNGLFTSMLLGHEWALLARRRKTLRVSLPRGRQRSTYWLQLPYHYAIPMVAAITTLHWLISQSLFIVRVKSMAGDAVESVQTNIGFSCIAIFFAVILGLVMVTACIATGLRRLYPGIPLAGSCSLAISAACHRPVDDVDAALMPVIWGEVTADRDSEVGHCCITSHEVCTPSVVRLYAGKCGSWCEQWARLPTSKLLLARGSSARVEQHG